jgi:hypothetical protein
MGAPFIFMATLDGNGGCHPVLPRQDRCTGRLAKIMTEEFRFFLSICGPNC